MDSLIRRKQTLLWVTQHLRQKNVGFFVINLTVGFVQKNNKKPDKMQYYDMITSSNKNFTLRKRMALAAISNGVKPTAKLFGTTPKTVRKWRDRFCEHGNEGLQEISRRPLRSPNKTPPEIEALVIRQRKQTPGFGGRRLVEEFDLPVSHNVANRIIKAHGLTRKRRKKHHTKNDLRKVKAAYKAFTRFQMDTKDLCDLPNYWVQMQERGLPRYQYTIRELSTGAQFLTYSSELSKTYATLTIKRFLEHIKSYNIDLSEVIIKTDNGAEYDGGTHHYKPEGFHETIERTGAKHLFNPPAQPNFNADVESVHATIEPEFYEAEKFKTQAEFYRKSTTYQIWYNIARKNSSRSWKSPLEIQLQRNENLPDNSKINPRIFLLHPVFCDNFHPSSGGYDVPGLTGFVRR